MFLKYFLQLLVLGIGRSQRRLVPPEHLPQPLRLVRLHELPLEFHLRFEVLVGLGLLQ